MKPSLSQNQKASAKLTCKGGSLGEGEEGGEVEVDGAGAGAGVGVCISGIQ